MRERHEWLKQKIISDGDVDVAAAAQCGEVGRMMIGSNSMTQGDPAVRDAYSKAKKLLIEITGKEGGLVTVDWYSLQDLIAGEIMGGKRK